MRGVVLLVAAGGGTRLGAGPKAFIDLCGVPLVRRAADAAAEARQVDRLVVAVPPGSQERATGVLAGLAKPFDVVDGGETRQSSVSRALAVAGQTDAVVVHDAARPLCPPELFDRCLEALDEHEAVVAACAVKDTIKVAPDGIVASTLDRSVLVAAQTPQAFRTGLLRRAHEAAAEARVEATDDVALVERLGIAVRVIPGDERNLKITTPLDLVLVQALVRREDGR